MLRDWIHEVNPAEVSIDTIRELVRCDEMSLRNGTCWHIEETKEEVVLLRELLLKALIAQGREGEE